MVAIIRDSSSASLEEQLLHLHSSCRALELFREESRSYFPCYYLHHKLYKLSDGIFFRIFW